jgi:hypothetical protein
MSNEDPQATSARPKVPRGALVILGILAVSGLVFTTLISRDENGGVEASDESTTRSSATATTVNLEVELVIRLREILGRRDVAYRERDPSILEDIYAVDCPCLKSDSNAIQELIKEDSLWVGGETSIRVRRLERVTEKMWVVIADFRSEPLRIETESGRVVRNEPRGSEQFQFVLVRPTGSTEWLLGRASSFDEG